MVGKAERQLEDILLRAVGPDKAEAALAAFGVGEGESFQDR